MINPSKFIPHCPEDFIGDARHYADVIAKMVQRSRDSDRSSLALLFTGPAGVGKSSLARWLVFDHLKSDKFSVNAGNARPYNGTQINVDRVEDFAAGLHFRDMFSDYKIFWIDECDKMSTSAQVRMLSFLDDLQEIPGAVVLCTSNDKLSEFEPRFQSRFTVLEFKPPTEDEVKSLLSRWAVAQGDIQQIATFACGNVRQALKDAELALN